MAPGSPSVAAAGAGAFAGLDAVAALLAHVRGDGVARHYLRDGGLNRDRGGRAGARTRLSASLAGLSALVERSLAELFREYIGSTVTAVSPLVVSACRMEGLDLDAVANSIRHDGGWRRWLGGPPPAPAGRWRRADGRALGELQDQAVLRQFQRCGVVIREDGDPRGALGIRVGARCLELAMRTDRMELTTCGGRAALTLRHALPETIRIAARGRLLDQLVDLPLTNGRGLSIIRALCRRGGGTSLLFEAEPLPWRLPWVRGPLDGAFEGACPSGQG